MCVGNLFSWIVYRWERHLDIISADAVYKNVCRVNTLNFISEYAHMPETEYLLRFFFWGGYFFLTDFCELIAITVIIGYWVVPFLRFRNIFYGILSASSGSVKCWSTWACARVWGFQWVISVLFTFYDGAVCMRRPVGFQYLSTRNKFFIDVKNESTVQ